MAVAHTLHREEVAAAAEVGVARLRPAEVAEEARYLHLTAAAEAAASPTSLFPLSFM
ncbi:MAG TPA: hypothetical protein VGR23_07330 [Candidatus Dormibacteraeota bacterium]|nr:hypothetical protein [Candidatus Dormibacteraeota bacterium]